MRAMLTFLSVFASIAISNAVFLEFSEDAFKSFISNKVTTNQAYDAEVINFNQEFKFNLNTDVCLDTEVILCPAELTGPAESAHGIGHSICGNVLGIDIKGFGTYCNTPFIQVDMDISGKQSSVEYSSEEEIIAPEETPLEENIMFFLVHFGSTEGKQCSLGMPIFKIPSEIDSSDGDKVRAWAAANKVGLLPPSEIQNLSAVNKEQGWTLNFKWLSGLLKYGVMQAKRDSDELFLDSDEESLQSAHTPFISRPIAMAEADLNKLEAWVNTIKLQL